MICGRIKVKGNFSVDLHVGDSRAGGKRCDDAVYLQQWCKSGRGQQDVMVISLCSNQRTAAVAQQRRWEVGWADVLDLLHVNKVELVARQHTRHVKRLSQVWGGENLSGVRLLLLFFCLVFRWKNVIQWQQRESRCVSKLSACCQGKKS